MYQVTEDDAWVDQLNFFYDSSPAVGAVTWVHGPDINSLGVGWHHVAAQRDAAGTLQMWIDGALASEVPGTDLPVTSPAPITIGSKADLPYLVGRLTDAALDEVRISSVARYSGPFVPADPLPVDALVSLHWGFDEGAGSTATDDVEANEMSLTAPVWE